MSIRFILPGKFVFMLLITQIQEGVANQCPMNSYTLSDGYSCYWLTTTAANQEDSSKQCKSQNGFLAIISNQQVSDELKRRRLFAAGTRQWIGVNDRENEGVYKNSDGSHVSWTNWANGQPYDPNIASLGSRDCVYIEYDLRWYDDPCHDLKIALCFKFVSKMKTSLPPPTTTTITSTTTSSTTEKESTAAMLTSSSPAPSTTDTFGTEYRENTNTTADAEHTATSPNVITSITIVTHTLKTTASDKILNTSEIRANNTAAVVAPVCIILVVGGVIFVVFIIWRRRKKKENETYTNTYETSDHHIYDTMTNSSLSNNNHAYTEMQISSSSANERMPCNTVPAEMSTPYYNQTDISNTNYSNLKNKLCEDISSEISISYDTTDKGNTEYENIKI